MCWRSMTPRRKLHMQLRLLNMGWEITHKSHVYLLIILTLLLSLLLHFKYWNKYNPLFFYRLVQKYPQFIQSNTPNDSATSSPLYSHNSSFPHCSVCGISDLLCIYFTTKKRARILRKQERAETSWIILTKSPAYLFINNPRRDWSHVL